MLVEAAARTDPTAELADAIDALAGVADVAVAADDRAARELWRYREGHTEAINLLGAPHKLDVTLPADELAAIRVRSARAGRGRRARTRRSGCSDTQPTATFT